MQVLALILENYFSKFLNDKTRYTNSPIPYQMIGNLSQSGNTCNLLFSLYLPDRLFLLVKRGTIADMYFFHLRWENYLWMFLKCTDKEK